MAKAAPKTYAEYKAREDKAVAAAASLKYVVPQFKTPELLQVFFHARYHGRSKSDLMKILDLAFLETSGK